MNRPYQPSPTANPQRYIEAAFARARPRATRWFSSSALAGALALAPAAHAQGLPSGGVVSAGTASIAASGGSLTVTQASQNAAINWQSFNIAAGNAVTFVQPNSAAVALNRVVGPDPSAILGRLSANGKVFLVNPNGIFFGTSAQVNVGGLVASTLNIADADFMAGQYKFSGSGGTVLNQGSITAADGGYVALLGAAVGNDGVIQARLGSVALAAGHAITLDVAGDGLLNVAVNTGAMNALVENGGLIRAHGGQVVMTAQAAGQLIKTVVNNTGVIEAQSLASRNGRILLLGDLQGGTMTVAGVLDASAPNGGNGGFIETSAARVNIANDAKVTTAAPLGVTGTWLIDPEDFTIAPIGGNISGATLSALLVTNSVTIRTVPGADATVPGTPPVTTLNTAAPGNGDIFVNDAVSWVATPSTTTLRLEAVRDVVLNAAVTATNGNFVICCGRDANINAAITTTNGSMLINAGNNINVAATSALTTTDGNIALCAGNNLNINGAVTLTRGSTIPAQSLGLPVGMLLVAGFNGTGPGVAGGTVVFGAGTPPVTVTGPNAPVTINYNPPSYAAPRDFSVNFTLTLGATLTQQMLVFPNGNKAFDGTTATTLSGFNSTALSGLPTGVTLIAGPGAVATFDSAAAGSGIGVTFSGYTLGGPDAARYALAASCCVPTFRTASAIAAAPTPPPPPPPPVPPPPPPAPPPPPPPVPPPGPGPTPVPPTSGPTPPPGSTPTPTSTPAPLAIAPLVTIPILGLLPVAVGPTPGLDLAVLEGGVRLPPPVIETPVEQVPVVVPPPPPPPPPVVPVYPPKQARN